MSFVVAASCCWLPPVIIDDPPPPQPTTKAANVVDTVTSKTLVRILPLVWPPGAPSRIAWLASGVSQLSPRPHFFMHAVVELPLGGVRHRRMWVAGQSTHTQPRS